MNRRFLQSVLSGYAQIYFAKKWQVGLLFCLATFVIPWQGVAGLCGLLLADLFALILGFSRDHIQEGYFAYNGLLTGLALGLTYRWNLAFMVILAVAAFMGVIFAAVIRALNERYFPVPVLSMPFVLTSWIVIAAGQKFHGLIFTTTPFEMDLLVGYFPPPLEFMLRSLGAALFQLSVPAGILVALGLLIFSRQAFMLACAGLFSGYYFHLLLGGSMLDLRGHWIGFNFALTAIAVGGVFIVPGADAYLLAIASALLVAVVAAGSAIILSPLGLPMLAFPFLATTICILYALKSRICPRFLQTVTVPAATPENNLRLAKNRKKRLANLDVPAFELPVSGAWTVTQGVNGQYTHQQQWAYAWDLEVIGEDGKKYKEDCDGLRLSDYYSWNMPVFAPADGKIVRVVNHLEDNPVGQVDTKNNWGNTVIVWHYGSVYTSMSHLAKGSITVNEGEIVRRGHCLGKVGNSGRSPYPHLHFQVQYSPELGAPTAKAEILHYVVREKQDWVYHTQGVPAENQIVRALETDVALFDAAAFPLGRRWQFAVTAGGKKWQETWTTEIDFAGKQLLVCTQKKAQIQFLSTNKFLLLIDYEGTRQSALLWFFLAASRIPFTSQDVKWSELMPPATVLGFWHRLFLDIVEPFCSFARLDTSSCFLPADGPRFWVKTSVTVRNIWSAKTISQTELVACFEKYRGLASLKAIDNGKTIMELEQILEN